MVLTHIKRALIYLAAASLWLAALSVQGHPGRTDAEGCHKVAGRVGNFPHISSPGLRYQVSSDWRGRFGSILSNGNM